jgi:hypothetical protein
LTQGGGVQLHVTTFISVDLYVSAPPEYGAGKIFTAQIITQSNYWARLVCPDSVYSLYKKKKKKTQRCKNTETQKHNKLEQKHNRNTNEMGKKGPSTTMHARKHVDGQSTTPEKCSTAKMKSLMLPGIALGVS